MTTTTSTSVTPDLSAVPEGGSYEVIRRRLLEQAAELGAKAEALNRRRKTIFGATELTLVANERVRTENNCVPRDIVSIAGHLLFGYHVFIGLKSETNVSDVFSLHAFAPTSDGFDLSALPLESAGGFLTDAGFVKEFKDLFRYVREARLLQLRRTETRLLAIFQVGASVRDVKVFRWSVDAAGRVAYMDSRGESDHVLPRAHDFEWTPTTRENQVPGRHPHVSILDEVFVETVGGDLTVKIENNTDDGLGIYREPVEDPNQSLDDADIQYARLGGLILIRVRPFREKAYRYLVFNTRTKRVQRIDAIGLACQQLPEDHGVIFPGGYVLQSGDVKIFEGDTNDLEFERVIKSPNGEDVLYVFHRPADGLYALFPYNVIRKQVQNPIRCHGYSLFDDGKMVVFRADSEEPTRVHPMQIWQTPFTTAEYAARAPTDASYLAKVGNADLVRGISDALSLRRLAETPAPTRQTYEELIAAVTRMLDAYYWLGHEDAGDLLTTLQALRKTAESIIDEFEKVVMIRKRAAEALAEAEAAQKKLTAGLHPDDLTSVDDYMAALTSLRKQRGHLITLRELRAMDLGRVDALEAEVVSHFDAISRACAEFLQRDTALRPLVERLAALVTRVEAAQKAADLLPMTAEIDAVNEGLALLSDVVAGLKIDDATARTRILESISEVYAQLNRARATLQGRKKDLAAREGRAEFAAQFKLFGQSVTSALALCDSPEACDEQLSRLLLSLEELEGRFGEFDEFASDLAAKREEVTDAFGTRRQMLLDERQRRAQNLYAAAERILQGIARRARGFKSPDELNAYWASDAMVLKLGDLAEQLAALGDSVKSEEVRSRLKSSRQDALRALRDRQDLFEGGDEVIKLGRHRFSVQSRPVELTLVPREGRLALHLTGTDFYEPIEDPVLEAARDLWDQQLVSESADVYRGEYLAATILFDAEDGKGPHSLEALGRAALAPGGLLELVRAHAAERYDEGYERGLHDVDAALILEKLLHLRAGAGLLRYGPAPRAAAWMYWALLDEPLRALLHGRARSVGRLRSQLASAAAQAELAGEVRAQLVALLRERGLPVQESDARAAARYLVEELAAERPRFVTSAAAISLRDALHARLERDNARAALEDDLRALEKHPAERYGLALAWLEAFVRSSEGPGEGAMPFVPEAAALMVTERRFDREPSAAPLATEVQGLLGQHPRIAERKMPLRLDEFLARLGAFVHERAPRYRAYRQARQALIDRERARLRLDEFAPKVMSAFVRNRLIDEVYLPLVGANMAKQIGAVGDGKRTDQMGMLLLVSPPGYGKTTLMEYVANRLGLVFVKVNGPALGHEVKSLDPSEAPNATARQEVEKINFAFEMGNNVMLYLDDIQHTHPELLQKFISLCDAQRKIEGVWRGRTRTYDLRGKRFCVVMAGNPYTESGARFQIPDMLANRADTYNLGDILEGKGELFALSYIENALTSNPTLAPLAGRDPGDVQKFIRMARGEDVPATDLSYGYSSAEMTEIVEVLRRLFRVQEVLLKVNAQYIASAAQDDAFRTEPPFKLQGSYRNMNKVAEKVVAAMNEEELERLLDDHYAGEAQTLTKGAEQNLLKLAEIRGRMTPAQRARWTEIKEDFARLKMMGGKQDDPVARVTGTLSLLGKQLDAIGAAVREAAEGANTRSSDASTWLAPRLDKLESVLMTLGRPKLEVAVHQDAPAGLTELIAQQTGMIERTLVPLVRAAATRSEKSEGLGALAAQISELVRTVRALDERVASGALSSGPLPQYDVALGPATPSNFYRGLMGEDVLEHGGLFVATFQKLPKPGTHVALHVALPGGAVVEALGIVEWTREERGSNSAETPPGFGARLRQLSPEARALVTEYVRHREPLFHESS